MYYLFNKFLSTLKWKRIVGNLSDYGTIYVNYCSCLDDK